jgi:hypothetical protein
MMKYVLGAALVAVFVAAQMPPSPPSASIITDFSANVTMNQTGEILHGYMYQDFTGQRSYLSVTELAQVTFTFQPFGSTTVYAYTITTSGCTCEVTPSAVIMPWFAQLATAKKSAEGAGCSGTLYENVDFPRLQVAPHKKFCMAANGEPVWAGDVGNLYTFSNFKAGRSEAFPTKPLNEYEDQCNAACL